MTLTKLQTLKLQLMARAKALVALLGTVLGYLEAFQVAHPNPKVAGLIAVLTVLGVHQVPNL